MQKAHSLALVAAGRVSRSLLARLPGLAEHLGPVKGPSYRLASRVSNILRAGHPVRQYRDLKQPGMVLIHVPDQQLRRTVEELALVPLSWKTTSLVLCDTSLDSGELALLAERGAAVASLSPIPGQPEWRLLVEGDRLAVTGLRKIFGPFGLRLVEVDRGLKPLFLAGLSFAGEFCTPWLAAADRCLQGSGLPRHQASRILEGAFEKALRGYLKAGRNSLAGGRAPRDEAGLQRQYLALRRHDAELAQLFAEDDAAAARMRNGKARFVARAAAS